MKKIIISFLLGIFCLTGCQSSNENTKEESLEIKKVQVNEKESNTSDFLYVQQDGGIVIRSYNGNESQVIIPDTIDGLPVTKISEKAFYDNETLEKVKIPVSVNYIGEFAFCVCPNLQVVDFGCENRNEIEIDEGAFYCDRKLTGSLIIKANTIRLGNESFQFTDDISDIALLCDSLIVEDRAFSGCGAKSVFIKESTKTRFDAQYSNSEEGNVFEEMTYLEKIFLPGDIDFITEYTFKGDPKVVVYAPQDSKTIIDTQNQGIPVNTQDYQQEYNTYLQAYQKLGY